MYESTLESKRKLFKVQFYLKLDVANTFNNYIWITYQVWLMYCRIVPALCPFLECNRNSECYKSYFTATHEEEHWNFQDIRIGTIKLLGHNNNLEDHLPVFRFGNMFTCNQPYQFFGAIRRLLKLIIAPDPLQLILLIAASDSFLFFPRLNPRTTLNRASYNVIISTYLKGFCIVLYAELVISFQTSASRKGYELFVIYFRQK